MGHNSAGRLIAEGGSAIKRLGGPAVGHNSAGRLIAEGGSAIKRLGGRAVGHNSAGRLIAEGGSAIKRLGGPAVGHNSAGRLIAEGGSAIKRLGGRAVGHNSAGGLIAEGGLQLSVWAVGRWDTCLGGVTQQHWPLNRRRGEAFGRLCGRLQQQTLCKRPAPPPPPQKKKKKWGVFLGETQIGRGKSRAAGQLAWLRQLRHKKKIARVLPGRRPTLEGEKAVEPRSGGTTVPFMGLGAAEAQKKNCESFARAETHVGRGKSSRATEWGNHSIVYGFGGGGGGVGGGVGGWGLGGNWCGCWALRTCGGQPALESSCG